MTLKKVSPSSEKPITLEEMEEAYFGAFSPSCTANLFADFSKTVFQRETVKSSLLCD
jgi:hypothetical protein